MRIIGLTGVARSGKDTVAGILAEELPGTVIRQGFADALKLSAALALGYSPRGEGADAVANAVAFCDLLKEHGDVRTNIYLPEHDIDKPTVTGRRFLQLYGTEAHRDVFGPDFWLDAVLPEGRDDCDWLLIPDVRFPNEAERVRERGGELWRIERPGVEAVEAHASEAGVPKGLVDAVIGNEGSIEQLREVVRHSIGAWVPA